MPEETNCEEHDRAIAKMEATMSNAKWVLSAAGAILGFILTAMGALANISLSGIRDDVKDSKGMLQTIQLKQSELGADVNYLKAWKQQHETEVKR